MSDVMTCSVCDTPLPERKGMKMLRCVGCNAVHLQYEPGRVRKVFSGFEKVLMILKPHPTIKNEYYTERFGN